MRYFDKKIVVRLDDICETMDLEKFQKMESLLDEYGIKPLIGVVPINKDVKLQVAPPNADFKELIARCMDKGWAVAMHGTYHLYDSKSFGLVTKRPRSEFAGKTVDLQRELLRIGKEQMMSYGIYTDIFFAPGHSYDSNTVNALRSEGFRYISDGRSFRHYRFKGVDFIPVRVFSDATIPHRGITTLCFHTNNMNNHSYETVREYFNMYKQLITSFEDAKNTKPDLLIKAILEEKYVVFFEYYVRPVLRHMKTIFLSKLSRTKN